MTVATDPRRTRLENEWRKLQKLNQESDTVRVAPVDCPPGSPPEKYRVTMRCRGIVGVDSARNPVFGDEHRVLLECQASFPDEPPALRCETAVWHPNMQHQGSRSVCINKSEWLAGQTLVDLCRMLLEMVQYRNYHALSGVPPNPLDSTVAQWVREVAEPRGIVNKAAGKAIDDKPFTRPTTSAPVALVNQTRTSKVRRLGT